MKKFLLFCLLSCSSSLTFATVETKEPQAMTAEMVLVENSCIPVHLTCGTYALCSTEFMSADEMMQTVLAMEEFYCG